MRKVQLADLLIAYRKTRREGSIDLAKGCMPGDVFPGPTVALSWCKPEPMLQFTPSVRTEFLLVWGCGVFYRRLGGYIFGSIVNFVSRAIGSYQVIMQEDADILGNFVAMYAAGGGNLVNGAGASLEQREN